MRQEILSIRKKKLDQLLLQLHIPNFFYIVFLEKRSIRSEEKNYLKKKKKNVVKLQLRDEDWEKMRRTVYGGDFFYWI